LDVLLFLLVKVCLRLFAGDFSGTCCVFLEYAGLHVVIEYDGILPLVVELSSGQGVQVCSNAFVILFDLGIDVLEVGVLELALVGCSELCKFAGQLDISKLVLLMGFSLFFKEIIGIIKLSLFFLLPVLKLINDSLELFYLVVDLVDDSVLDLVSVLLGSQFIVEFCLLLESFFEKLLAEGNDSLSHLLQ